MTKQIFIHGTQESTEYTVQHQFVCLFVCLDDLPIKGTRQTPTRGYKHQAGNSQSLLYKHWFNVYDYMYELHKSRNCDSVTKRQYFF